jgi:hypothetical protein
MRRLVRVGITTAAVPVGDLIGHEGESRPVWCYTADHVPQETAGNGDRQVGQQNR